MITKEGVTMVRWIGAPGGGFTVPPPASLDDLHGGSAVGKRQLEQPVVDPAAPWRVYDLASRVDRRDYCLAVIRHARQPADLADYLSAEILELAADDFMPLLPGPIAERWRDAHPHLG
ncbi:hypothetical protein BJ973_003983 [Actinoplanes tereljensis]|nr:hypothetical protein [Actinoplanes tereljensis]